MSKPTFDDVASGMVGESAAVDFINNGTAAARESIDRVTQEMARIFDTKLDPETAAKCKRQLQLQVDCALAEMEIAAAKAIAEIRKAAE